MKICRSSRKFMDQSKTQNREYKIQMPQALDSISEPLKRKFSKHRIIFWYDDDSSMRKEFDTVELEGVEKVVIENNEFGLKHQMLRQSPEQNFLVYKSGPQPDDIENWLLDIQLSNDVFRTDRVSQTLDELELPIEFRNIVVGHEFFFNAVKRKSSLERLLKSEDNENDVRRKMLAVCAGSDPRIDSVVESLLGELADNPDKTDRMNLISKSGLEDFLWEQLRRSFGYVSETPSVQDFAIELFKSCYAMETGGDIALSSEAVVFLKRWMDSYKHRASFEHHSKKCAEILRIAEDLQDQETKKLIDLDYFELIDQKILSELSRAVMAQTISAGECKQIVRGRRNTYWYEQYADIYETIAHGTQFLDLLNDLEVNFDSLSGGVAAYTQSYYLIDQAYRKFVYFYRRSENKNLFGTLFEQICNQYTNKYLLELGDRWQSLVNESSQWNVPGSTHQREFFNHFVRGKFQDKNKKKLFVIVSDALRYEAGEEFCTRIKRKDMYEATLTHMITGLPSYTQLGMASLLPNEKIEIRDDKGSTVVVDGISATGTANRDKILKSAIGNDALAVQAKDLLELNSKDCRQLVSDHSLIYVYHDKIDHTGKKSTEREVFAATETAFEELESIIRKLTTAKATNLIVTSDHGFLYQDEVGESDYTSSDPSGTEVCNIDRRFVVGRGLNEETGMKRFAAESLGLAGDLEVIIPKSINRFRRKGSATRFVHGGCTLQEIVVPVIQINKSRLSDQALVDVDLISGGNSVISAGQLAVNIYQTGPVSDKVRPRHLRVGLYAPDGMLISDVHDLIFDFESESPREREQKLRLVLSKLADSYNEQQVTLRLEEPVSGTSRFTLYKSAVYTLRRLFTSDFDL